MTTYYENISFMHVEPSTRKRDDRYRVNGSPRNQKRRIEQSFYNQLYDIYIGQNEDDQNSLYEVNPHLEEGDTQSEVASYQQSSHSYESVEHVSPQHEHAEAEAEAEAESQSQTETPEAKERPPKIDGYLPVLKRCLNSAGENAFGVAAIEIWSMTKKKLVCCEGGYWRDPIFPKSPVLNRLENPEHPEYVSTKPVAPGVGAAGKIWSTVCDDKKLGKWVDLYQLVKEDSTQNTRLNLLAQVFGLAMGVYFHNISTDTKGVIIFYARSTVDFKVITCKSNMDYLRSSADLFASIVSWKVPREEAIISRQEELKQTMRRIKVKMVSLYRMGALADILNEKSERLKRGRYANEDGASMGRKIINAGLRTVHFFKKKIITTVSKMIKGGGKNPPKPLAKPQIIFAFLGCFLSLLTLSALNEGAKARSDGEFSILLGPLGALVTCHYGLTGSPASQPRNSFVGILITSSLSTASTFIPTSILPVWVRVPAVTSVGIATTLGLGFAHPPAGAISIIFSEKPFAPVRSVIMLLFGYAEAIFFAIVFINLYESSTFPMYWGVTSPRQWFCRKPKH